MKQINIKHTILIFTSFIMLNACTKDLKECAGSEVKNYNISGFSRIEAGHHLEIDIKQGNNYSIKATGCASDLGDLNVFIGTGNILHLQLDRFKKHRYRLQFEITLPHLAMVQLSGASKATINGFDGQNSVIRTILSGAAECILSGTGINTNIELSGASKLKVTGSTLNLYGILSGDSKLESYGLLSDEVDISVSGRSKAYVLPLQQLFAEASGESRIFYKGNPGVKHIVTSGNAKVIHE